MNDRRSVPSGAVWEPVVGYCRTVRIGVFVVVAGTTAADAAGCAVGAVGAATD